jgi:NTE family protein
MEKIGLALGAGGAKGLAHIVVIEAFEELGIKPAIISGVSVGAIVGAFYAAGKTSQEMKDAYYNLVSPQGARIFDFIKKNDFVKMLRLLSPEVTKTGFIKGEKFLNYMHTILEISKFEELKIPLKIVAADLWKREEVILEKGNLYQAIRASYSLPGLFTPIIIGNKVLVDGGAVNPVPYDILMDRCDIVVAVSAAGQKTNPSEVSLPPTYEAIFNVFQIMQNSINEEKMKRRPPDIYVKPDIRDVRTLEFHRGDYIFEHAKPSKELLKRKLDLLLNSKKKKATG